LKQFILRSTQLKTESKRDINNLLTLSVLDNTLEVSSRYQFFYNSFGSIHIGNLATDIIIFRLERNYSTFKQIQSSSF